MISFFKQWIQNFKNNEEDGEAIYNYLRRYRDLGGYDMVFFVCDGTKTGYYSDGHNLKVSEDGEGKWYSDFIKSGNEVGFDFGYDKDPNGKYIPALFVDCCVYGKNGEILGVIGEGLYLEKSLTLKEQYEKDFDSDIYVVNLDINDEKDKNIYVKSPEEAARLFDINITEITEHKKDTNGHYVFKNDKCIYMRYLEKLNICVIVSGNFKNLVATLSSGAQKSVMILTLSMIPVLIIFILMLRSVESKIVEYQNTDELTNLSNNRLFKQQYDRLMRRNHSKTKAFAMLDIDNFKHYNDTMGHLYGNTVLQFISTELKQRIGATGYVGRWGGDEFVIIAVKTPEELKNLLDECNLFFQNNDASIKASMSIGIVEAANRTSLEKIIKKADQALYKSKENGKAQSTIL